MAAYRSLPSGKVQAVVKWRGRRWYRTGSKTAVQTWARNLERDLVAGLDPDRTSADVPTVEEWGERWMAARVAEPATLAWNRTHLGSVADGEEKRGHIYPRWRNVRLDDISTLDVQSWVRRMERDGVGPPTIRAVHLLLAMQLSAAVREGLLPSNPCDHVALPATPPPAREVFLSRDQVDSLAAAAGDHGVHVLFLAYTGARWGEGAGLTVRRLDFLRRSVDFMETSTRYGGKAYPKGALRRTVPLPDHLLEQLAEQCRGRTRTGLVFPAPSGAAWDDHNFRRRVWADAVSEAGLDQLRPRIHDLRHTYASWLVQEGVSLREVQRLLGHKSITTTERYAHLVPDAFDRPRAALERPLSARRSRKEREHEGD